MQLQLDGERLVIRRGDGREESVALTSLHLVSDDGVTLFAGRRGRRNWRLWAGGSAAALMREPLSRRGRRLRWASARAVHAALFLVTILAVELVKLPAEWVAPLVPNAAEASMIPTHLYPDARLRCSSPAGERAIRRVASLFDPRVGRTVHIEVFHSPYYVMSALPDNRLYISDGFLTGTEGDEFAALLAHQVAHLKRDDAPEAVLRSNGLVGTLDGMLFGWDPERGKGLLDFSREDERAADNLAVSMLLRNGISTKGGAQLFQRMKEEWDKGNTFGKEQRYLHYGVGNRVQFWSSLPDKGVRYSPAFTRDETDALFNYCVGTHYPQPDQATLERLRKQMDAKGARS